MLEILRNEGNLAAKINATAAEIEANSNANAAETAIESGLGPDQY